MAADAYAHAIVPTHTTNDGDTIFVMATGEIPADVDVVGALKIKKRLPAFTMDYNVDPVKKEIAESWPNSLDDTCAREEWGWRPEWDLSRMTDDMLAHIRAKLGAE